MGRVEIREQKSFVEIGSKVHVHVVWQQIHSFTRFQIFQQRVTEVGRRNVVRLPVVQASSFE